MIYWRSGARAARTCRAGFHVEVPIKIDFTVKSIRVDEIRPSATRVDARSSTRTGFVRLDRPAKALLSAHNLDCTVKYIRCEALASGPLPVRTFQVGDLTITRIPEAVLSAVAPQALLPSWDATQIQEHVLRSLIPGSL